MLFAVPLLGGEERAHLVVFPLNEGQHALGTDTNRLVLSVGIGDELNTGELPGLTHAVNGPSGHIEQLRHFVGPIEEPHGYPLYVSGTRMSSTWESTGKKMIDSHIVVLYNGHMDIETDVPLLEYDCCRCQHRWYPRKPSYPKRCPSCTSAYWDTPTKREMKTLDTLVNMNSPSPSPSPSKMLKGG